MKNDLTAIQKKQLKEEMTAVQKLQDIVSRYATDNAILVECVSSLIVILQEHADMEDPEVRSQVGKALLILGENPADAD